MGADEEGTHEWLQAHLRELIKPKIGEHRGRVVKNTGDGFLAEFASVVDAVRCAVEVQRGMADHEPEVPEEWRIRFRMGINLGDVIAEEHDIFGDGVNLAARLEALAEPGEIPEGAVPAAQCRPELFRNCRHLRPAYHRNDHAGFHHHVVHSNEQRRSLNRIKFTFGGMK
jgi:adenylate cyclase